MFQSLIKNSIPKCYTRIIQHPIRITPTSIRFNSTSQQPIKFDQEQIIQDQNKPELNNEEQSQQKSRSEQQLLNIDELLNISIPSIEDTLLDSRFTESYAYDPVIKPPSPRDVAKSHRVMGTNAGRTVEIDYNNISKGFGQLNRLLRDNKVRYLQRIQARFIKPAKLRKQQNSERWRAHFKKHFKETLSLIKDAKRRGY
ncbi:unnamed protein product [Candida verbasci]|uniref:Uncharacterized protein n=1 Tax=Candida verbasci TaxID=1227364 RepID=A0A9W4XEN0_9ASCO|nr:unnamed protein product [Candida verbasci]